MVVPSVQCRVARFSGGAQHVLAVLQTVSGPHRLQTGLEEEELHQDLGSIVYGAWLRSAKCQKRVVKKIEPPQG
jgi:hypothetical protein